LASLSKSLRDFFERKHCEIPKDMTVVLPARLYNTCEDPSLRLENRFYVELQTFPIDENNFSDRVTKIVEATDVVNASPDYLVNYWIMSLVSALKSKHCTVAVSNLPGPNFTIKINGQEFENVGFFLPNVGLHVVSRYCLTTINFSLVS
jgi:WS/DGAT C-terminal domain